MSFGKTINLGNSIIGVSILAMPYCFVKNGLLLSMILLIFSSILTRLSCHLLLKSAFISRRRNLELMVQDVLGPKGRVMVELGMIGFLLGTCVAYFIMIGDLAPRIVAEFAEVEPTRNLRLICVIALSLLVALPLSLLRKVDSLTSFSLLSMFLYVCLIIKLMFETNYNLEQFDKIIYWDFSGLLITFPIFSMAMSCQTSLFEIFDSSNSQEDLESVRRDNSIIMNAVYLCLFVYMTVGILGYLAFHDQILCGNLLLSLTPSISTTLAKIGFLITLLLSFPLCVFPCRTSVYSLTIGKLKKTNYRQQLSNQKSIKMTGVFDGNSNFVEVANEPTNCDIYKNEVNQTNGNGFHRIFPLNIQPHKSLNDHPKVLYTSLLDDYDIDPDVDSGVEDELNYGSGDMHRLDISDFYFKLLTIILIGLTVILSLIFPNIEFILGVIGSTAGTIVCFILPAFAFIRLGHHTRTEKHLAQMLLTIGFAILIFCTYSTISNVKVKR